MQPVTLDRTELRVSRLSFGTGSLHHCYRRGDRVALLHAALDAGITHFDTSPLYGFGLAEADLGAAFSKKRAQVTLTTKVGLYPPFGPPHAWNVWLRKGLGKLVPQLNTPRVSWDTKQAEASLTRSLKRCRTDYFDLLLLHEPSWLETQTDNLLEWVDQERQRGRIRNWGLGGIQSAVESWVHRQHPLANVVQTRDSLDMHEADFMSTANRPLQFTYGYLGRHQSQRPVAEIIAEALSRNRSGSIIVSTRRLSRITELVEAAY